MMPVHEPAGTTGTSAHRTPLEPPPTRILAGKRIVITGVLTEASLAFAIAAASVEAGADVVLTGAGRSLSLTRRVARRLPSAPPVYEFDAIDATHGALLRAQLAERWDGVDGVVHAIGFAPPGCFGEDFLAAQWDEVQTALHVSAYSYKYLVESVEPLLTDGASVVGLDFDATVAWPVYGWMGVAKSTLESVNRYLARQLGERRIRCNLVAAGPIRTQATRHLPAFDAFGELWDARAPLGWSIDDPEPIARSCVALLSDWLPATTGSVVYADGGSHAVGM